MFFEKAEKFRNDCMKTIEDRTLSLLSGIHEKDNLVQYLVAEDALSHMELFNLDKYFRNPTDNAGNFYKHMAWDWYFFMSNDDGDKKERLDYFKEIFPKEWVYEQALECERIWEDMLVEAKKAIGEYNEGWFQELLEESYSSQLFDGYVKTTADEIRANARHEYVEDKDAYVVYPSQSVNYRKTNGFERVTWSNTDWVSPCSFLVFTPDVSYDLSIENRSAIEKKLKCRFSEVISFKNLMFFLEEVYNVYRFFISKNQ